MGNACMAYIDSRARARACVCMCVCVCVLDLLCTSRETIKYELNLMCLLSTIQE